jgi:hypothetical protein
MKLITETSFDLQLINESKDDKQLSIVGIFSSAGLKNENGRVYSKPLLEREVKKYMSEKVNNKSAWGELGHPQNPEINPERIAIIIESLRWKDDHVYGKARVLDTPAGKIAATLVKEGKMGISSRGLGSVNESGQVQDDFQLVTYDLVTNPSNNPSWVNGIFEGKEFDITEKKAEPKTKEIPKVTNDGLITMKAKDYKWDNISENHEMNYHRKPNLNEVISAKNHRWHDSFAGETAYLDADVEPVKKDLWHWGSQSGSYGSINDSSPYGSTELHTAWNGYPKVIYVDQVTNKIAWSVLPDFPKGSRFDENVKDAIAAIGWHISFVNMRERDWEDQIRKR